MSRIYKRKGGEVWWIGYRLPGDVNERRESSKSVNRKDAERLLKTRTVRGGEPKSPQVLTLSINAILDVLEAEYATLNRKTTRDTSYRLRSIRRLLGAKNGVSVTRAVLVRYAEQRQAEGVQPATINREFAALRRAMKLVYREHNVQVPSFPMFREQNIRQGTYTKEEIVCLLQYLPKHLHPVVWFAYYTGRRRGEILALRWEYVDWDQRLIIITPTITKNSRPDVIVLEGPLYTLLWDLWRKHDTSIPWIFTFRGKRFLDFHHSWNKAKKHAGLPDKLFHDIRRTTSTDLIEAGVPEQVAMRITGHKTRATFDRYHIVKTTAAREAMERLDEYRKRGQSGDSA